MAHFHQLRAPQDVQSLAVPPGVRRERGTGGAGKDRAAVCLPRIALGEALLSSRGRLHRSRCLRVRDRRLGSPQADRARAVSAPEELHGADRRAPQGPRGNARGGSAASGRSRMSSAVAWLTLFAAGVLDVLWAVTMKYAAGYTKLGWSIASLALLAAFVFLLGRSLQVLPVGTAYAVWTGVGARLHSPRGDRYRGPQTASRIAAH